MNSNFGQWDYLIAWEEVIANEQSMLSGNYSNRQRHCSKKVVHVANGLNVRFEQTQGTWWLGMPKACSLFLT
jgi:hypothetical protein